MPNGIFFTPFSKGRNPKNPMSGIANAVPEKYPRCIWRLAHGFLELQRILKNSVRDQARSFMA